MYALRCGRGSRRTRAPRESERVARPRSCRGGGDRHRARSTKGSDRGCEWRAHPRSLGARGAGDRADASEATLAAPDRGRWQPGDRCAPEAPSSAGVLTLYFDASAFTKLCLAEEGSVRARELWEAETPLVTSWITFAEASAAIGAARRSRRLSRVAATDALRRLETEWESVTALAADAYACKLAGSLATRHRLRGMDAIHIASALLVAVGRPIVVTWDGELRRAARAEGLAVAIA